MTMPTNIGHVMNLANSIIGVSLLAMPFCFKQCGITLAILMLILSSIISRLACHFLVKSSTMCRRRNFEFLAFYTFGSSGKLLVELGVIGFMMGTCVAFFVVMGDLGPAIISKIFNISNDSTLRTTVLLSIGVLVVLPLGLLRNVESLASISMITIGFYLLFILKIFFESSPHLISGDWWYHVNFWQPEGVLQCTPIFAMALSCQTQVFEIYESLPTPTIEKMNSVVHSALNLCTIVYTSVGLLGYIAYFKGTFTGNVLLSFTPSLSSEMFKLGFVMSIALSFPLVIFPCRASLYSLIFRRVPVHHELSQTSSHIPDSRFKCLTIAIVGVALVTGLLIPSIEIVLGFLGSTIGIAICVIFPSLSFLNLNNKKTNERIIAKATFLLGLLIMIMGTFGNLFPAVENNSVDSSSSKSFGLKELPQMMKPLKADVKTESLKNQNTREPPKNPLISEKLSVVKPPDVLKIETHHLSPIEPTNKLFKENRRQEPPVPVAPAFKSKGHNVDSPPLLHVNGGKKEVKIAEDFSRKTHIMQNKEINILEPKLNEAINKDAIEKEEREIMEVENQKKTEEEKKQEELLKILREHQNEQKKLLREQEKILYEMKQRESEKKLNEAVKKKIISNSYLNDVKPIKSDEFKDRINKIQNVVNKLQDGEEKEIINNKSSFISLNLNISNQVQKDKTVNDVIELKSLQTSGFSKVLKENKSSLNSNSVKSVPLPLVKQVVEIKSNKAENFKKTLSLFKQEVLHKDNLTSNIHEKFLNREKRDAEENKIEGITQKTDIEKCLKNEEKIDQNLSETEKVYFSDLENKIIPQESLFVKQTTNLIKNSEHLSVNTDEKKPKIVEIEHSEMIPDILGEPLISKKRDLKSFNTRDYSFSR